MEEYLQINYDFHLNCIQVDDKYKKQKHFLQTAAFSA